ncbi:MAG: hypothetical protein H0U31_03785 [Chloroflexia bacterium]|nr:hypothetical protein [Chloroflexia bacterium]
MVQSPKSASRLLPQNPALTRRRALALGGAAAVAPLAMRSTSVLAQEESGGGSLFPESRVLLYYGFPTNENMGLLGEFEPARVLELLEAEADNYRAADPSRAVRVGFEMIASIAQASPGDDGKYIADASPALLDQYTQFTADNDILLFFDVQMGFREPFEDYSGLEEWMAEPHVHLGIDPEFHMRGEEIPGVHIGQVTAAEVTEAQNWLSGISETYNVPPKTLIVHQFHFSMIEDKDQIQPVDGVDLVIDMDGFGPPDQKEETYTVVITQQPIEHHGIKLFYKQDVPLMTPVEVLALEPSPDLIIYQ